MLEVRQQLLVVGPSFVEALVIDFRHFLFDHFSFYAQLLLEPERFSGSSVIVGIKAYHDGCGLSVRGGNGRVKKELVYV